MEHFYRQISGWFSFSKLYDEVVRGAKDGAHFVEVGCWKGRSTAFMAVEIINSKKKIRFDCVDTWLGSTSMQHYPEVQAGKLYDMFLANIAPVRSHINIIRKPSVEAAVAYGDNSLDFVFIDADHGYQFIKGDLEAWWPKVRVGGIFAGDDFHGKSVHKAVPEMFPHVEEIAGTGTGWQWRVIK
jgi:hypothetical protein